MGLFIICMLVFGAGVYWYHVHKKHQDNTTHSNDNLGAVITLESIINDQHQPADFGELRSLLQAPELDQKRLFDLMAQARQEDVDLYQSQWLPYVNAYISKQSPFYIFCNDLDELTHQKKLAQQKSKLHGLSNFDFQIGFSTKAMDNSVDDDQQFENILQSDLGYHFLKLDAFKRRHIDVLHTPALGKLNCLIGQVDVVSELPNCPHIDKLEALHLEDFPDPIPANITNWLCSKQLQNLKYLGIGNNHATPTPFMMTLISNHQFENLTHLNISSCRNDARLLEHVDKAFENLGYLVLDRVEKDALEYLGRRSFKNLKQLQLMLDYSHLFEEAMQLLYERPKGLTHLSLRRADLQNQQLSKLLNSSIAQNLVYLDLTSSLIDDLSPIYDTTLQMVCVTIGIQNYVLIHSSALEHLDKKTIDLYTQNHPNERFDKTFFELRYKKHVDPYHQTICDIVGLYDGRLKSTYINEQDTWIKRVRALIHRHCQPKKTNHEHTPPQEKISPFSEELF